jgi:protein TonB
MALFFLYIIFRLSEANTNTMKVIHLLIPFILFLGCSHKNTGSTNIQAFRIKDTIVIFEKEPFKSEEKPFAVVEQMPSFPGGDMELLRFISKNLKYPAISEEQGFIGSTGVRFVITKTGNIKDVVPAKDVYKDFAVTDSLMSVIKRMPRWNPGKHNGKAVDVYYTIPLHISPARR